MDNKDLGAPPASQDRVTDAPHEAASASSPSGSVPTGASFTPGPWLAIDHTEMNDAIWIGFDHPAWGFITHAEVRPGCDEAEDLGDMKANARLIAAAPDMFDALVYARESLGDPVPISRRHVARRIDAALSKARGEQP